MNKRTRKSRGQIAIVFAVALPVLLGAVALCTDVGVFYLNWEYMQKAADAAVLAGANRGLPYDPALAIQTANQYAELNGVKADEIVYTKTGEDNMSLSMKITREVPYYFGKVLGLKQGPVTVAATAGLKSAGGACGFLPIGIPCNSTSAVASAADCPGASYTTYENGGSQMTLKPAPAGPSSMQGPGNWEPLALGGSGASTFETNIASGYSGAPIAPGTAVNTETGQVVGPTFHGFQQRMANAGQSSYQPVPSEDSQLDAASPQAVLVPLVNYSGVNGNSSVEIVGFQEMWITGVNGSNASISGYLINKLPGCSTPSLSASNSINEYSAILTK